MADIRYDVSQLFKAVFGINSPIFITEPLLRTTAPHLDFSGVDVLPNYYQSDAMSWMGTPIMFSAAFEAGRYKRYIPSGEIQVVEMQKFQLPPATLFQFRRAKNITRTNVLGSNGTVKEIFGFDDWVIDVKGFCLDEPNRSAQDQLKILLEWEELADSIEVSGSQFGVRELHGVCINEWSDSILQGQNGAISFQMQLYGDEPLELKLGS